MPAGHRRHRLNVVTHGSAARGETASGTAASTSSALPSVQIRGASTASWQAHAVIDQVEQRLQRALERSAFRREDPAQ